MAYLCFCAGLNAQVFLAGDTLNPAITYVDIPDTILPLVVKGQFNFDIDVDFDGVNDIRFHRKHHSSPHYNSETFSVISLDNVQFVVVPGTSLADTLIPGIFIDNYTLNWSNTFGSAVFYYYYNSWIPPPYGQPSSSYGICTQPDTYIGFRKINEADTLYGWFNLDLLYPYKIKSYAVNQRFGSVPPEPEESIFSVFPNPANNLLTVENPSLDGASCEFVIYNSSGQVVMSKAVSFARKLTIDLNNFSNGLYFLTIKTKKDAFKTKFLVVK
jgi:hypothetical protein